MILHSCKYFETPTNRFCNVENFYFVCKFKFGFFYLRFRYIPREAVMVDALVFLIIIKFNYSEKNHLMCCIKTLHLFILSYPGLLISTGRPVDQPAGRPAFLSISAGQNWPKLKMFRK